MAAWSIRRYAGSLDDARGILAVEQATFRECPYTARELLARLGAPGQQVWVACELGQVVGFLVGFRTAGIAGPQLEADLLAVDPHWQRKGIATALLTTLRDHAAGVGTVRGIVNLHNAPSEGAFARAGFRPSAQAYDLLIYRIRGQVPRPLPPWSGTVERLRAPCQAGPWAALLAGDPPANMARVAAATREPQTLLLAAAKDGAMVGGAELLQVQTLLYAGLWLESLHVRSGESHAQTALVAAAVEEAKSRGLDEVGCLAPQDRWPLRATLLAEGFAPLDSYRIWAATPSVQEVARS